VHSASSLNVGGWSIQADVRDVLERKSRLRAVFKVKVVHKEVICEDEVSNLMHFDVKGLTPSTPGLQQGFLLMSRVSRVVLYFWSHVRDTDYLNQVQLHQGFSEPFHADSVVRKVKDLECPIPFKDLRDVRNTILADHAFSKIALQSLHQVLLYAHFLSDPTSSMHRAWASYPVHVVKQRSTRPGIPRSCLRSIDNLPQARLIRVQ